MPIRLGQVDYLNCLPVYYPLETGQVALDVELVRGVPTYLNRLFLDGELDITPLSSIEYARHPEKCVILPDISISSDGRVGSILLFSRLPVTELDGRKICLPSSSATSVALLRILLEHYYHVEADFETTVPDLDLMLARADAGLLIGDDALLAHQKVLAGGRGLLVTDLGAAWKEFTGEKMVFALWVIRRDFALAHPEETGSVSRAFLRAREISMAHREELIAAARRRRGLPRPVLEDYFDIIRHEFDPSYRRALLTFYDYAYKSGLIEERVGLAVWGDGIVRG
ncbi:MAG: menaquinone biosynthesis protein [Bacillota bacterium]